MHKIEMPHIKRKLGNKYLFIPGGWFARVPRVKIEPCVIDAWALYLRQEGMGVVEALDEAKMIGQRVYAAGDRPALLSHTMYWAAKYARAYPETLEEFDPAHKIYSLHGYDPEIVQSGYVPQHKTGKHGKPFMNRMLREMRENG